MLMKKFLRLKISGHCVMLDFLRGAMAKNFDNRNIYISTLKTKMSISPDRNRRLLLHVNKYMSIG